MSQHLLDDTVPITQSSLIAEVYYQILRVREAAALLGLVSLMLQSKAVGHSQLYEYIVLSSLDQSLVESLLTS